MSAVLDLAPRVALAPRTGLGNNCLTNDLWLSRRRRGPGLPQSLTRRPDNRVLLSIGRAERTLAGKD